MLGVCRGAQVLAVALGGSLLADVPGHGGLPGGGIADCCNDHRIAMSGAVAAALSENGAVLLGTECVGKSYPAFWEDFASLGGRAETIALEN